MSGTVHRRWAEWGVTLPSFLWLGLLFLVPTILVFAITFRPADPLGGIGQGWTLNTFFSLGNPNYPAIVWRTIWMSVVTTAVCIVLATPMAYHLSRVSPSYRRWLLLLVILPFWTSFLVRVFAWKVLLHPDGFLKHSLEWLGLIQPDTSLLYNAGAVLLVMIYTELPFAILPIYAAAEKFDYRLIEAAKDLGAGSFRAFRSVFLPGIRVGLFTAFLMVFIPSLGSYVIPDIVGGPTSEMIGNKIAQRTFVDRNLPHAAGLSALLSVAVLIPMIAITSLRRKEDPRDTLKEEGV